MQAICMLVHGSMSCMPSAFYPQLASIPGHMSECSRIPFRIAEFMHVYSYRGSYTSDLGNPRVRVLVFPPPHNPIGRAGWGGVVSPLRGKMTIRSPGVPVSRRAGCRGGCGLRPVSELLRSCARSSLVDGQVNARVAARTLITL